MEEENAGGATPEGPVDGGQERGKWANKTEFLLSMAGEIVGLGNVWRFPYLCFKNGGGIFFIPYFVFLFFCGIPVFFLETALGQYTSEGGVTAWRKICPMFEGVGVASQVIVMYLNVYHIVILAWTLFYLFNSFWSPLPWSTCDNYWNTEGCLNHTPGYPEYPHTDSDWSFLHNESMDYNNNDIINSTVSDLFGVFKSPEEEFWTQRVLRMSEDMSLAKVNWDLAICLLVAWIVCYFCIWKGIKSTGKAVYFTATFPYLLLFILFIRGVTLPGAGTGLKYYLYPDLEKITNPGVWRDAATQVFFSFATCQGVLTALGSYNKYNNNCYKDCVALCVLNSATSIFAGFVVFSILGFMSHQLGVSVSDVAASGPGLAFLAIPKALSWMPGAQFWAVLFFLMIFFLGLDTQFVCVESLATAITDMFPAVLRKRGRREILVLVIAVICFLLGLPFITKGGIIVFNLVDMHGPSGTNLLFIACFECIIIGWIYGANRFYDNIEDMIGYRPFPVLKCCWLFVTPLICGFTLWYEVKSYSPTYIYGYMPGSWSTVFACLLTIAPLICIPIYIFVIMCKNPTGMTTPSSDLRQAWPHRPRLTLFGHVILKGQEKALRSRREEDEKLAMVDTSGV